MDNAQYNMEFSAQMQNYKLGLLTIKEKFNS